MKEKIDLLIKNANIFNSFLRKFLPGNIAIVDNNFLYIDYKKEVDFLANDEIDLNNKFVIPGLIDIHMHIESSMVTPSSFCNYMTKCGVTTIVSEPHEIANIMGVDGVLEMIKAGTSTPIDVFYGIPSSVPSTNKNLETTLGKIDFEDMKYLMNEKKIICLGEVMNYKEVIRDNSELDVVKFIKYLKKNNPNFTIEGHCPELVDLDLGKYIGLGIDSDHTEHTLEEFKDRFRQGMFIEIQEKTLKPELLKYIIENDLFNRMAFVTDDVMADKLYTDGHLDNVVRKAINSGFPTNEGIYCSTYTPAMRMNLKDRGSISPGKLADFVILDDLHSFKINSTYKNGRLVYEKNKPKAKDTNNFKFPKKYYESVNLNKISKDDLDIFVDKGFNQVNVRLMKVSDKTTRITEEFGRVNVVEGKLDWENSQYNLGVVFERFGLNGNISFGLIKGDCIKVGGAATTWFHDSHNLFAMGKDKESIVTAVNTLIENQGGVIVVNKDKVLANLHLPVCGIMSEEPVKEVAYKLDKVTKALISNGYNHYNPIMSMGTLGLAVSPYLKLTDMGLVDVPNGKIVNLVVENK